MDFFFIPLIGVFAAQKFLSLMKLISSIFFSCSLCLQCHIQEIIAKSNHEGFLLFYVF